MAEIPIKEALNKAYIKVRPERAAIEKFKTNYITLIDTIKEKPHETEEFLKNLVSDFLKNTWYALNYFINTSARYDLVIHTGKTPATSISVIIEVKRLGNKNEMISRTNLNAKAMQELLLYYLRETIDSKNIELKHLTGLYLHVYQNGSLNQHPCYYISSHSTDEQVSRFPPNPASNIFLSGLSCVSESSRM